MPSTTQFTGSLRVPTRANAVLVEVQPSETRPQTGERCLRCRRIAPRNDGIPCELCAPYGPTTIDEHGVTHNWRWPCPDASLRWLYPVVSASPIDCMTCLVYAARRL